MEDNLPAELDVIALLVDLPKHRLVRGQVGTILEIFDDHEAYLVEFSDNDGREIATVDLTLDQIMRLLFHPLSTLILN